MAVVKITAETNFLTGDGDLGALIRDHDWLATPLGPPQGWPQPLKTLVGVMLGSNQPMFVVWGSERTLLYNDPYSEILAANHPDALGRDFLEVWADIQSELRPFVEEAYAGRSVHMDDITLVMHRRGYAEETHFTFSYTPVRDEYGAVAGFFCPCTETTDSVLSERRIIAEIERQRRLFDRAPGFITVLSGPEHVFEFVNETYARLFGNRAFLGRDVRTVFPELEGQGFFELLDQVYTTGVRFVAQHVPIQLRQADDPEQGKRFLDFIYEPVTDHDGRVTGIFCEGHDVTEVHLAQEALRVSEARLSFLDQLGARTAHLAEADAILETTTRLLGMHLNLSVCAYADMDEDQDGFTIRGDWAAPGASSIVGHYRLGDFGKLAVKNLTGGLPLVINDNIRERPADEAAMFQSIGIAATACMPLVKEGRLIALMAIHDRRPRVWTEEELNLLREVTARSWAHVERVGAVSELRTSEARLRALNVDLERQVIERTQARGRTWQISPDLMGALNAQSYFETSNPAWQTVLGWSEAEVASMSIFDMLHPDDVERTKSGFLTTQRGRPAIRFPNRYRCKDGTYRWISWTGVPEDGLVYCTGRDITEEMQKEADLAAAQEALRQSQKLEAMGQLTGGVAHDFNNLLTPIVGSLDMLQRRGVGGEREQRLIAGALQSADRAKVLVQRLLAFARRQPLQSTVVDVASLARGMADLVASTIGPQIKVVVDAPDDLPTARADANQLEMAILNLAVNARDAMPDGGTLRISIWPETIDGAQQGVLGPGGYIRLSVADTGTGMDEATLARAIEPFFSTKGIGQGTGLGLSMVHGLVSQLGGALDLYSQPGIGTNVILWLPQSREPADMAGLQAIPSPAPSASLGTVLLVDDEDLVRLSTADMLSELGYAVTEASSAKEALRQIEHGLRPDLLVTDHLMPGMTGTELAHRLMNAHPKLRVLIVSGYAESDDVAPDLPRLRKPFRSSDLAHQLARMVNPSSADD